MNGCCSQPSPLRRSNSCCNSGPTTSTVRKPYGPVPAGSPGGVTCTSCQKLRPFGPQAGLGGGAARIGLAPGDRLIVPTLTAAAYFVRSSSVGGFSLTLMSDPGNSARPGSAFSPASFDRSAGGSVWRNAPVVSPRTSFDTQVRVNDIISDLHSFINTPSR